MRTAAGAAAAADGKNRIEAAFERLEKEGRKAFIPYLAAGVPSDAETVDLILEMEKRGADIVELGFPFSDPMADGVVNQAAANRALELGVDAERYFGMVREIRRHSQIPLIVFAYLNPLHRYGLKAFARRAREEGADGMLIVDMPVEESGEQLEACRENDLCNIFLVAPTTTPERLAEVLKASRGFLYYISRTGITGVQDSFQQAFEEKLSAVKKASRLPVVVGFGIGRPEQVRQVCALCDGAVVGSALVRKTLEAGPGWKKDFLDFAAALAAPTKEPRG